MTLERVVAVVGSEPVLHSDVVSMLIESGIDEENALGSDPSSPAYQLAMEQLIEEKLLVEAARRDSLYPGREEIEEAVDNAMVEIRSGFPTEQGFIEYLASMGMTIGALRDSYTSLLGDRIAGENYVRLKAGTAMNSLPSDPVSFFAANPEIVEEILAPRHLSWIYLPVLPGNTQEAEAFLTELRAAIEAGTTTFSAAAAAYSQDGSAASGGDLDWFSPGDMTATFEQQVFSLEPGEIAGPFRTPFGVHLVKLTDRDESRVRASHILIMAETDESDLDSTMALANRICAELSDGADFAQMVSLYSLDQRTADTGGYLGTVNVGAWEGELKDIVLGLAPGEVSAPVAIEQSTAVAVFKTELDRSINWADFSGDELDSMLQSVFWNISYTGMVDSLRASIPVLVNVSNEN
jgi:parvulin-like peptidyl-prolyl isomerase